jgi:arginyl-tRNA synthetase
MFEEEIIKLLKKAGISASKDQLEVPPRKEFGDFSFPVFNLAKEQKKNANEVAKSIYDKIKIGGIIQEVQAKGPYVNFFLNLDKISSVVMKEALKKDFGKSNFGKNKKILVEFAHPNTHKGFHIGHLRNISTGESICRILDYAGFKLYRCNYQGDIGPHVAKTLWGFIKLYNQTPPEEAKEKLGEWLGKIYAEVSQKMQENPEIEKEVEEINKKLYAGDMELLEIWKETRKWSLDDFEKIYKELGSHFDKYYFEAEVEKRGKEISLQFLENGVFQKSEDAVIFDLTKYNLGTFVLITKNGTPLYHAKDLALAEKQMVDFKPDLIIHVVGSEQKLYFEQLFKTLEIIKSPAAERELHVIYELVALKEGQMSSRQGSVILYTDLRKQVFEKVKEEVLKRNPTLVQKKVDEISNIITTAAMKYPMLNVSTDKTIHFDWQEALKLEGNTAPYIQYAITRAKSILKKGGKFKATFSFELVEEEKDLIKLIQNFEEVVVHAAKDYKPHYIANYAYDLATSFNKYYEKVQILKSKEKNSRLTLVKAVKEVLEKSLCLLGIEVPEKM